MVQQINCNVRACMFHDQTHACTLHDITVGNSTPMPRAKHDTQCASFQPR